ncbi:hypothetical protein AALA22_15125 [Anaerovoracaceae bacterium 41-7]
MEGKCLVTGEFCSDTTRCDGYTIFHKRNDIKSIQGEGNQNINRYVNKLKRLEELETSVMKLTGYDFEQLVELFSRGYTIKEVEPVEYTNLSCEWCDIGNCDNCSHATNE